MSGRPSIGALVIVLAVAGGGGFALGRATSGFEARLAAASAQKAQALSACPGRVETPVRFTATPAGEDLLILEAVGPLCDTLLVRVSGPRGGSIFSEARVRGEDEPIEGAARLAAKGVLPAWPEGAPSPPAPVFRALTERGAYEKARSGDLPILLVTPPGQPVRAYAYFAEAGSTEALAELAP